MNDLVSKSGLPANISNMVAGLAASASTVKNTGGDLYMKFAKGDWSYGVEETAPESDSVWAINPNSFQHGWTAWGSKGRGNEGANVGEKMVSATQPLPLESDLPDVNGDWSSCIGMQLRCLNGEDAGLQVLFKSSSVGGRNAYASIIEQLVERAQAGEQKLVPVVRLESDSYKHSKYGKLFTPILKVDHWLSMSDAATPDAVTEPEPEPEPAQRTRAARAEKEEPATEEDAEPGPASPEEEAPRRRRRKA